VRDVVLLLLVLVVLVPGWLLVRLTSLASCALVLRCVTLRFHSVLSRLQVATKGVRVGWMVATHLVPIIPAAVFAKNRYVFRQVREEMAAVQYGDRQFWGKPHLTLQVYGRLVGSMLFDAVFSTFSESRLLTLTDVYRTMSFVRAVVCARHGCGCCLLFVVVCCCCCCCCCCCVCCGAGSFMAVACVTTQRSDPPPPS